MTTKPGADPSSDHEVQNAACDEAEARNAVGRAVRQNGDITGTLSNEYDGSLRKDVYLEVLGCRDLTDDGNHEMVVLADGVGAGGTHPVNWYIFENKDGVWRQAFHREQPNPKVEISGNEVVEITGSFKEDDPFCCPSGKRRGTVRFIDGEFYFIPEVRLPSDLTIEVDTQTGEPVRFGPFDAFTASGKDFRRVLGRPSFEYRPGSEVCENQWSDLGLRVSFVDLGGGDACKGLIGRLILTDEAAAQAGWKGPNGIRVGMKMNRLRSKYPELKRASYPDPEAEGLTGWDVVERYSQIGDPGWVPSVTAYTGEGEIARIDYLVGAGGD